MRNRVLLCSVPLALGLVAYAITTTVSKSNSAFLDQPSIELPDVVDMGARDPGPNQGQFTIRNRGKQALELSNIRTGCGCMSVQFAGGDQAGSITHLTVPPEDSCDLILNVSLRPDEQSEFRTDITFRTNDPDRPEISLPCVAFVAGSITTSPTHWLVGNVIPSDRLKTRIEIRDTGRIAPCTIERVTSNNPAIVRARLLPDGTSSNGSAPQPRGRLLAVAELELAPPSQPQEISVIVSFFEPGRAVPVLTVPVSGRLLARVDVVPSAVVLPRQTGVGPTDEITVIVKSSVGEPFTLAVDDASELAVQLALPTESRTSFALTICWPAKDRPQPGRTDRRTVSLTAGFADGKTQLSIPVAYRNSTGAEPVRP
jgi:hypothetical protein